MGGQKEGKARRVSPFLRWHLQQWPLSGLRASQAAPLSLVPAVAKVALAPALLASGFLTPALRRVVIARCC